MEYFKRLFQGRMNRQTYLVGVIPLLLILFILAETQSPKNPPVIAWIILFIDGLFLSSIHFRRFHDVGKSGWWGTSVKMGNGIYLFKKGENKVNKYGKPPEPKIDIKSIFGIL